jgi:hypothetical protein
VAIVVNGVPLDALVVRRGSNRNAIYKMMFDARRKLRTALAADGYLDHNAADAHERLAGTVRLAADRPARCPLARHALIPRMQAGRWRA